VLPGVAGMTSIVLPLRSPASGRSRWGGSRADTSEWLGVRFCLAARAFKCFVVRFPDKYCKLIIYIIRLRELEVKAVSGAAEGLDAVESRMGCPPLEPDPGIQPVRTDNRASEPDPGLNDDSCLLRVNRDRSARIATDANRVKVRRRAAGLPAK